MSKDTSSLNEERIAYLEGLVSQARTAAAVFTQYTQEDVDRIVKPMVLAGLGQAQVDLRRGQRLVRGRIEQAAQHALGQAHRRRAAVQAEQVAAIGDLDAEAQFNLAQMLVERSGEVGQPLAVVRLEREIAVGEGGSHGGSVTRRARPDQSWARKVRDGFLGSSAAILIR